VSAAVVIAVDGTAACGKGTLARLLARHYRFAHLDSGALYRLVALGVIEANGDPANEADAVKAACVIEPARAIDPVIRSDVVGRAASQVAAILAVRRELFDYQRRFAQLPPGGVEGAVIDGRDIGTVIVPDAPAKLFVDARPEVRAHRRWLELQALGIARDEDAVLAELNIRDAADRNRPISPLKQAVDAALLDTSDLGIDAAFAAALTLLDHKVKAALAVRHRG
jgi:cytidylate kinase